MLVLCKGIHQEFLGEQLSVLGGKLSHHFFFILIVRFMGFALRFTLQCSSQLTGEEPYGN